MSGTRVLSGHLERYITLGWHLVPLSGKRPTDRAWNVQQNTVSTRSGLHRIVDNVGLAHEFSGTCAIDIDDLELAAEFLADRGVNVWELLEAPDAVQIISGKDNHAKLLYRIPSPMRSKQISSVVFGGKQAVIDFRCAGKQDVLPPSVHPETGQPYQWQGDFTQLPMIPDALLALWGSLVDLTTPLISKPAQGVSLDVIETKLSKLDPDMTMHEWIQVGMGIHHELGDAGFDVWLEWSKGGSKFKDKRDLQTRWRGFKASGGVTIAVLDRLRDDTGPEHFDVITGDEPDTEDAPLKFPGYLPGTFEHEKPPVWFIKGVMPQSGLGVIYGESGSGKSFLATDMALHIGLGIPWRGHRVRKSRVLYLMAEGQSGAGARLKAFCRRYGYTLKDLNIVVVKRPPSLLTGDWKDLVKTIQAFEGIELVIIDTLGRVMPGADENSFEAMSKMIDNCGKISDSTGVSVILIHHSGKDQSKGARGHSSLKGACDFELEVTQDANGVRTVKATKQKDAAKDLEMAFRLEVIDLGTDDDGDPITSCVVSPDFVEVSGPQLPANAGVRQKGILEAYRGLMVSFSEHMPTSALVDEVMRLRGLKDDQKGNVKTGIRRSIRTLISDGYLVGDMEKIAVGDNV